MQRNRIKLLVLLSVLSCAWLVPGTVSALIMVYEGNAPVENRGWPTGTEEVANLPSRLGYMEGPPFGGGEYYFRYRCNNTAEFNLVLEEFSVIRSPRATRRSMVSLDGQKADIIDAKPLLLVVHDYRSDMEDRVDWTFTVWVAENFHRLFNRLQGGLDPDHPHYRQPVPPPRIDVYAGGDGPIVWDDVKVPSNVRLIDKRAAAAPVDVENGGALRGRLFDMATHQVIAGADVVLMKRIKPRGLEETARAKSDDVGAFTVLGIPEGYYEIHVEAEGHAGRNVGWYDNRSGHIFHDLDALLVSTGSLRGQVVDTQGNPVPGVAVVLCRAA